MLNGLFGQYAILGIVVFFVFLAIALFEGLLLVKIFRKKWVAFVIIILNIVVFYFFDLDWSFVFILLLGIVLSVYFFAKKQKRCQKLKS